MQLSPCFDEVEEFFRGSTGVAAYQLQRLFVEQHSEEFFADLVVRLGDLRPFKGTSNQKILVKKSMFGHQ